MKDLQFKADDTKDTQRWRQEIFCETSQPRKLVKTITDDDDELQLKLSVTKKT